MFNGIPHPSLALWSKDDQLVMYRTFGYEDYKNRIGLKTRRKEEYDHDSE